VSNLAGNGSTCSFRNFLARGGCLVIILIFASSPAVNGDCFMKV
jgi:hypothetical protein